MDIKILVATHKQYQMPKDSMYMPIHVGKEGKELELGFLGDNTGDHISSKNAYFCELTALYWAWKNLEADAIGLAHYRRHFTTKNVFGYKTQGKWESVLSYDEVIALLRESPVVLPNRRKYYIETNERHYRHAHYEAPLDEVKKIISEKSPSFTASIERVWNRTSAHMFNMFIMRKDLFDQYCTWLFDILFILESRINISGYSQSEARVFGYISELLLDVWLDANHIAGREIHAMFMEKQNWLVKGAKFVVRKFIGKNTDKI